MSRAYRAQQLRKFWLERWGVDLALDPARWEQHVAWDDEYIRIDWHEHRLRQRLTRAGWVPPPSFTLEDALAGKVPKRTAEELALSQLGPTAVEAFLQRAEGVKDRAKRKRVRSVTRARTSQRPEPLVAPIRAIEPAAPVDHVALSVNVQHPTSAQIIAGACRGNAARLAREGQAKATEATAPKARGKRQDPAA